MNGWRFFLRPTAWVVTLWLLLLGLPNSGSAQSRRWPPPTKQAPKERAPELLFTFDDGPHHPRSHAVLDALAAHGIQAIFFWVGWRIDPNHKGVEKRMALVKRAVREGHIIGNHTIDHARLCSGSPEKAAWEIDENERRYLALTGMPMALFRAPYGSRCPRLEGLLEERNLTHLHWDLDPREYLHHDPKTILSYLKQKVRNLKGRAVILLHDTQWASSTALPQFLAWLKTHNQEQEKAGRRAVRILSYADLALERLPPELEWLVQQTMETPKTLLAGFLETVLKPLVIQTEQNPVL